MPIEKQRQGSIIGRIVGERRSGIDRRVLNYDWYIPERRSILDRRHAKKTVSKGHGEWRGRQNCA